MSDEKHGFGVPFKACMYIHTKQAGLLDQMTNVKCKNSTHKPTVVVMPSVHPTALSSPPFS